MRAKDQGTRPTDIQGRTYAKLSELKPGDKVQVDGDFTCMEPWSVKTVQRDPADGELFIECSQKQHGLNGQIQADGDTLIGIYPLSRQVRRIRFTDRI